MKKEITVKISSFKKNADIVYLATVDTDGCPDIRAMLNINNTNIYPHLKNVIGQNDKNVYFSTNTSSEKIKQINKNGKASVYFVNTASFEGILLTGTIENIEDKEILASFWTDGWNVYYPGGKDGGDFSILRFSPEKYKFYDGNLNKINGIF